MASLASAAALRLLMVFFIAACRGSLALRSAPSSASSSVEYWQRVLPSFPLPMQLLKRVAVPLDSSPGLITHYTEMIAPGAAVSPGLCDAARLYCSSQQFLAFRQASEKLGIGIGIFWYKAGANMVQQPQRQQQISRGSFFKESDLVEGVQLLLKDQNDPTPIASFLPRQLADKLHPASASLLEAAFNIAPSSLLAKESIHTSQALCKTDADALLPGEQAFCAYSLEDLADEVKARVADASSTSGRLQLLPISSSSATTVQARLLKVKLKADVGQPYLSCHAETYPFAVHLCHHIPNTRIYSATFEATQAPAEIIHAVAVCHMDTTDWSPDHVAFADLHSTPGHTEACHWIHENGLVFVAAKN